MSLHRTVSGLSETALKRFLNRAAAAAHLQGAVSLTVTGDRELRTLNRKFRGKDKPTDVLSFPAGDGMASVLAGDIAISAEIAARNARALGHSPALEVKILALHGVLHLSGHDHESDEGEMAALEEQLRRELRLPSGLIQRTQDIGGRRGEALSRKKIRSKMR